MTGPHKLVLLRTGLLKVVTSGALKAGRSTTSEVDSKIQCKTQYNKAWDEKRIRNGIQQKESYYITFYLIGDFIFDLDNKNAFHQIGIHLQNNFMAHFLNYYQLNVFHLRISVPRIEDPKSWTNIRSGGVKWRFPTLNWAFLRCPSLLNRVFFSYNPW